MRKFFTALVLIPLGLIFVVFAVAKRITVMHQGLVLAEGAPAEVRASADVQRVYLGNPEPSR